MRMLLSLGNILLMSGSHSEQNASLIASTAGEKARSMSFPRRFDRRVHRILFEELAAVPRCFLEP